MLLWRVPVLLLAVDLVAACAARPPVDPRTPAEIAFPTPDAWRDAASELASSIQQKAEEREIAGPLQLGTIQGIAPAYFRDLLLVGLIDRGVPVSNKAEAAVQISCRATPIGHTPRPRGLTRPAASLPADVLILCLINRDGAYVAAAQRTLSIPADDRPARRGIVIEVTG